MRFRSRATEVDAVQWTGEETPELLAHVGPRTRDGSLVDGQCAVRGGELWIWVAKSSIHVRVQPDEWVVRGARGELYPCDPDAFAERYDPVANAWPPEVEGK